jgi:aminoacrylate hydrolase
MLNYEISGRQDAAAETVILSAGLGGLAAFWTPQLAALRAHFKVITYDHAGTGQNRRPLTDDYSIAAMAQEVVEILDHAKIHRCHFIGHALGGLVGLELGITHPTRLHRLVIVNGWARIDPHTIRCFDMRLALLHGSGIEAYVKAQPIFLYPAAYLSQHAAKFAQDDAHGIATFQGIETLCRRIDALRGFDRASDLARIEVPTLVYASRDDVLVPYTCSEFLAAHLPHAHLRLIAEGGHGFCAIAPEPFNSDVIKFLVNLSAVT